MWTSPTAREPATAEPHRGIRTFLIADVRGYTLFTQERGDEAAAKLAARFAIIAREVVAEHGGSLIELRGDEALAAFDSARQAILAAARAQVTVIAGTVFMLRILEGRPRTRVLYVAGVFASGTWLVVLASGHVGGGFIAAAGMCLAMILFGVAETMWSPTYLPLVNELAPDDLRGRYNALSAMVQGGGLVIAPLLAGYLLQLGWGDALMLVLAAGAATAALFLGGLERRLSPETNTSANRRTWGRRPWPPLGPHP